jgi:demethylmenaquinone methyltransferase / 2-methoxy-6-polyprenyl-1,4-benzoquinol methylase
MRASRGEGRGDVSEQSADRRSEVGARALFAPLPKRYDLLAEVLSFGQNRRWRSRMVDELAKVTPLTVLDVATGTGGVAMQIAVRTEAIVIGLDISEEMLLRGREQVGERGEDARILLLLADAQRLPFRDGAFDALSFTYLLRYVPDPQATLYEMARVVKPGGRVASLEFFVPSKPLFRAPWWLYTRVVLPAAGALAGRGWFDVGRFLGPSISKHYRRYPLSWHLEAWRRAGMVEVDKVIMSLGGGLVMWGTKRGDDGA